MGLKNKITAGIFLSWIMGVLAIGTAFAQDLIIYPKEGQNQEQMEKDKYACYTWAKDQTGFDPWHLHRRFLSHPNSRLLRAVR